MSDALSRAMANAERMRDGARKAVSSGAPSLVSTGPGTVRRQSLNSARLQLEHGSKNWAFVAVRAIAQRIAGQDLFVSKVASSPREPRKSISLIKSLPKSFRAVGDRLEPLEKHPLLSSFAKPNPFMVRWSLVNFLVSNLEMTGRAYLWWSNGELYPLPSHWCEPADNLRTGWKIRPDGIVEPFEVDGKDIIPFYLPDPANPFGSLSPLQTQAAAVATDESIQTAQHRSFENGVFPQLLIKAGRMPDALSGMLEKGPRVSLEEHQRKQLISAIRTLYRGAVNHSEPLIVDGLIEGVEKLSTSPQEMDFLDSGKSVKSRILQAFGVNPLIVGEIEGANRAQAVVAEELFCSTTVNPLIELLSQTLSAWASIAFNESLAVWLSCCTPHDDEMHQRRWEFGAKMQFVNQNEYRTQVLNLEGIGPAGDVYYDPLTGEPRKQPNNGHSRLLEFSGNGRH